MENLSDQINLLWTKQYRKQIDPKHSSLQGREIEMCKEAICTWVKNPRYPALNFERLGSGSRQNHYSIRGSKELRVILAVETVNGSPETAAIANLGHHDDVYDWSERQGYYTDLKDESKVIQPGSLAAGSDPVNPSLEFEDWMIFLSDRRSRLIRRHYSGASRIRGAAGTGKTVIALHRAAELGHRYENDRILVTTFSRSLCNYMKSLFVKLPDAPKNVDFLNVHKLAWDILGGPGLEIDKEGIEEAFDIAYRKTVPEQLTKQFGKEYIYEEIARVIKGRGASREEYLDTGRFERLGRFRSLKKEYREICWRLREQWDQELNRRGLTTFEDCLLTARNKIWDEDNPRFRSAIIDEGQDLTLVEVQLVRGLVAGKPGRQLGADSILMVDDSAQRIYAGGFRPSWAGLDFSGRSERLSVNYRNSRSIFEAAVAVRGKVVVAKDANDDGAVEDVKCELEEGPPPVLLIGVEKELKAVSDCIDKLIKSQGYKHSEIAVLALHNTDIEEILKFFYREKLPCANLQDLRRRPLGEVVRVGTFDRAKGIEFRAVFIVRLGNSIFPLGEEDRLQRRQIPLDSIAEPELSEEEEELYQLHLDRLYVAMTRARERLFLIMNEQPCPEIMRAYDKFSNECPEMLT